MMEWAFHDTLPPIEYNITKAQMYMDMWKYSTSTYAPYGTPEDPDPTGLVAQGPLGDFDFSGYGGDVWDFTFWADNVGTATDALPWSSGHDIDPDANNDEDVGTPDFPAWADYPGYYYPERSKTWEWSR
jgi:hypothetical protein